MRLVWTQVCRGWNHAFHMPELWRCFEFELNQPASSYLKATHPDLIKQIIKRHADHLQYVSFKVRARQPGGERAPSRMCRLSSYRSLCHSAPRWTAAESQQKRHATSSLSLLIALWKRWASSPPLGPASWSCLRSVELSYLSSSDQIFPLHPENRLGRTQ